MRSPKATKRLRVFAGPNGSGKSTIIDSIRQTTIGGWPIDFGIYINADVIAKHLRNNKFSFAPYELLDISRNDFVSTVLETGLIGEAFSETDFRQSFSLSKDLKLTLKSPEFDEHLAQILAEYLRRKLLDESKKISFETVFSHTSKLEFMEKAKSQGYKIYLYFVSTESSEINVSRIKDIRVNSGGHDVPRDKIISRYKRSLDLLYDAAQLTHQTFFFDNSRTPPNSEYFAHFKIVGGEKQWDSDENQNFPNWFVKYYVDKQKS